MHKKGMVTAMRIITSKEGLQRKISVHRPLKKEGNEDASTFEERDQELEEKIKQKALAAKSDLKQNEDEKAAMTTEAEAKKRKK